MCIVHCKDIGDPKDSYSLMALNGAASDATCVDRKSNIILHDPAIELDDNDNTNDEKHKWHLKI